MGELRNLCSTPVLQRVCMWYRMLSELPVTECKQLAVLCNNSAAVSTLAASDRLTTMHQWNCRGFGALKVHKTQLLLFPDRRIRCCMALPITPDSNKSIKLLWAFSNPPLYLCSRQEAATETSLHQIPQDTRGLVGLGIAVLGLRDWNLTKSTRGSRCRLCLARQKRNASAAAFDTINKSALKKSTGEAAKGSEWINSRLLQRSGAGQERAWHALKQKRRSYMSYRELNRGIWEDVFHWIFWCVCFLGFFPARLWWGERKKVYVLRYLLLSLYTDRVFSSWVKRQIPHFGYFSWNKAKL